MSSFTYGMTHYYFERVQIRLLGDVCKKLSKLKFLIDVMHHYMEDTLQETKQPKKKFSNQVFISQLYSETVLNG